MEGWQGSIARRQHVGVGCRKVPGTWCLQGSSGPCTCSTRSRQLHEKGTGYKDIACELNRVTAGLYTISMWLYRCFMLSACFIAFLHCLVCVNISDTLFFQHHAGTMVLQTAYLSNFQHMLTLTLICASMPCQRSRWFCLHRWTCESRAAVLVCCCHHEQ